MNLFHGKVYQYFDKSKNKCIAIYLCDTNISSNICIIPLKDDDGSGNAIPITGLNKLAYPSEYTEINRSQIFGCLRIKGKDFKVEYQEYLNLSEIVFSELLFKTSNTYSKLSSKRKANLSKEDYSLTENYYKYLTWFDYKTKLQFEKSINRNPGILKGGIYYTEIGENIGSELHKLRPTIIFKKCVAPNPNDTSYIVIPITSKSTSGKYAFNPPIIVNGKINYVRINDMRRVSLKRIVGPLYETGTKNTVVLSADEMNLVRKKVKEYFVDVK